MNCLRLTWAWESPKLNQSNNGIISMSEKQLLLNGIQIFYNFPHVYWKKRLFRIISFASWNLNYECSSFEILKYILNVKVLISLDILDSISIQIYTLSSFPYSSNSWSPWVTLIVWLDILCTKPLAIRVRNYLVWERSRHVHWNFPTCLQACKQVLSCIAPNIKCISIEKQK